MPYLCSCEVVSWNAFCAMWGQERNWFFLEIFSYYTDRENRWWNQCLCRKINRQTDRQNLGTDYKPRYGVAANSRDIFSPRCTIIYNGMEVSMAALRFLVYQLSWLGLVLIESQNIFIWTTPHRTLPPGQAGHDKLCHIRPVLEKVSETCFEIIIPTKNNQWMKEW